MANRDENLKKINAELEKMSDSELEKVAGGDCYETADDSRFLNSLNGSCDRYGATRITFESHKLEIEKAWATVGIKATINPAMPFFSLNNNKYELNGKEITQEEARQHAMKVTGHHMTEKDWKW